MVKLTAVIVTIYDPNPNIGNRLQNYAVQTVLEGMGLEVTSIAFREPLLTAQRKIKYIFHQMTKYKYAKNKLFWNLNIPQAKVFNKFNNTYINTLQIKKIEDIPSADFYVLGSDQLWNPQWWTDGNLELAKNIYLATFARPEQIVCFSPSFGRNDIPVEWKIWFKQNLSRILQFSVREDAGKAIIKDLTGKEAIVTIDPTLMITREEWDRIATKPAIIKDTDNYILTYFLGGRSEQINKDISRYAGLMGADVYSLFDKENPDMFLASPSDFIYLVSHAKLILTDSFHACVFSFIYGKPFLVYNRIDENGMMSRLDTLLNKFDLNSKFVDNCSPNAFQECNYQKGYEILKKEQQKLQEYLEKSLKR